MSLCFPSKVSFSSTGNKYIFKCSITFLKLWFLWLFKHLKKLHHFSQFFLVLFGIEGKQVCFMNCWNTSHSSIENLKALKSMFLWGNHPVSWYLCQVIHYPRYYGIIREREMFSMPFGFVHMLEKPQCLLKSVTSWDHVRKKQKKCDLDTSTTLWNKCNN